MSPVANFIVYGLVDPRGVELRYVGCSRRGEKRCRDHFLPGRLKSDRTRKGQWVKRLVKGGSPPEYFIIERLASAEEMFEAERFCIAYFRAIGCRLLNLTAGGEAGATHVSPATRARISSALKGHPGVVHSDEARAAVSRAHRGKAKSVEHRERIGASQRGIPKSDQHRHRLSKGPPFVDELGNVFRTMGEAARFHGVNVGMVWRVLRGKSKSASGHFFVFREACDAARQL